MRPNVHHLRLIALLVVLIALAAYAVTHWSGTFGKGTAPSATVEGTCPSARVPSLSTVTRNELQSLREDIGRVTQFDPALRPYEQGLVSPGVAWSDSEPDSYAALSVGAHAPGGYEMRWWMANGDDVVADGFVFPSAAVARAFVRQATASDCRTRGSSRRAAFPPGGRDVGWVNPDAFAQQDVFIQRGRRAYRVAVVKAGVGDSVDGKQQAEAFALVNGLACALPAGACEIPPSASHAFVPA